MIEYAKGWYQYLVATVPARAAAVVAPYSSGRAVEAARSRLVDRAFAPTQRLNLLMVVSLVNWEQELLRHAADLGTCHHLDLGLPAFFDNARDWHVWREENVRKVTEFVAQNAVEDAVNVVFMYLSEFHVDPAAVEALRTDNVVLVNFNWDDVLHYRSSHRGQDVGVRRLARAVDLNLTMAVSPLSRYARDGAAAFYWYGVRAPDDSDAELPPIEYNRALFFGTCYGERRRVMDYLAARNLPLDVYGAGWDTGVISYEDLTHRIPRYALNLGVSTVGYSRRLFLVKGRDIEVPFAGGLYLTNDSEELRHVYEPDRDVLTYRSLDECYRKAATVLEDPSRFREVRRRCAERARSFSWEARFRYLQELLLYLVSRGGAATCPEPLDSRHSTKRR